MTPICTCADPKPVKTTVPENQYHKAYDVTACEICGYHYDVRYGSWPTPVVDKTIAKEG